MFIAVPASQLFDHADYAECVALVWVQYALEHRGVNDYWARRS
jgi:hypothetical protein